MVGLGGLEPPTSPLSGARSSHLSYRPIPLVATTLSTLPYPPNPGNSLFQPDFQRQSYWHHRFMPQVAIPPLLLPPKLYARPPQSALLRGYPRECRSSVHRPEPPFRRALAHHVRRRSARPARPPFPVR